MNRIILDTPFYQKKIISYGLIVYALKTQKCILVQRKHSAEFVIILCGQYRKSISICLLKNITHYELTILKQLIDYDEHAFKSYLHHMGFNTTDLDYAYQRFTESKFIFNQFLKMNINLSNQLKWTWPKGRINSDDDETGYMCALREFKEEVDIELPQPLYISPQYFNLNPIKTMNNKLIETRCWLYVIKDEIELLPCHQHKEVNKREWVLLNEAVQLTQNENIYNDLLNCINNLLY
jgi:ADP-ribose pyrophosphatase YjhB (NUDIX family)